MPRQRIILYALLVAAIAPYFIDLGGSSIWDANEAFYVQTPREMMQRGDYINPTFNVQPRFNKPVLSYWIVAGFYRLFGVSVGVQRIPIALGGLVIILTAFFLARAAASPRGRPELASLWAALGLAVAPRLLMFARRIFIDIYVSMFMGLTLLFFALSERYPARRRTFLLLMYASAGLGMLTKGPVAAALPAIAFAVYLVLHRELTRVREMMLPSGVAIVLAIVVPWYAVLYHRHGWTYITSFFLGENVARYTEGVGVLISRGPLFYLPVVLTDSFPWSLLLIAAAVFAFVDRRRAALATRERADALAARVRTLLWIWIVVIVGFFSASAAKQDLYIFPIVSAVAALAGVFIHRASDQGPGIRGWALRATAGVMGLVLAVAGAAVLYVFHHAGTAYALDGSTLVGTLGAIGGLLVIATALLRPPQVALALVAMTFIALNWVFVLRVLPSFERYKPVPPLSAAIASRVAPGDVVAHYNVAFPSMVYYLDRPIAITFDPGALTEMLRSDTIVYAVMQASDYDRLQSQFGVRTCVIARAPNLNVRLHVVLSRQPPPQVLVVTNRCAD